MKPFRRRAGYSLLGITAALLLMLTLMTSDRAYAQTEPAAPASTAAAPANADAAPAPAAVPDAQRQPLQCDALPPKLPPGNLKLSVAIDPETVWQPRNGEVMFSIAGSGSTPAIQDILVCFRWRNVKDAIWTRSSIRLVSAATGTAATYAASVPSLDGRPLPNWFARVLDTDGAGEYTGLGMVPFADFRVKAATAVGDLDLIQPIGITSRYFAIITALLLVIIAWGALYVFGRARCVPGGRDPVMTVVASQDGHASLSTFQIIMWSFVVGASAVYVMVLSGNLIEITEGTLVLLGISGIATLGNKLKADDEKPPSPPPDPTPLVTVVKPAPAPLPPDKDCVPKAPRKPLWSDLVVNPRSEEIEPSRVQMLFFTVIVALFVALRVLTSGKIPEIPTGYLGIMGISNGVYLTAKFIGPRKDAAEKKAA